MNLGKLTYIDENKIQIRLSLITQRSSGRSVMQKDVGRLVTLRSDNGAYKTVTRYFGKIPNEAI